MNVLKGESRDFFNEDKINILSPTKDIIKKANEKENWNLLLYVIMIEYAGHKVILGEDADTEVWDNLADSNELFDNVSILKASHHGRNSGYSQKAVSVMRPSWTICSVGKNLSKTLVTNINTILRRKFLLQDLEAI